MNSAPEQRLAALRSELEALRRADAAPGHVPRFLRALFRPQGRVNQHLAEWSGQALELLTELTRQGTVRALQQDEHQRVLQSFNQTLIDHQQQLAVAARMQANLGPLAARVEALLAHAGVEEKLRRDQGRQLQAQSAATGGLARQLAAVALQLDRSQAEAARQVAAARHEAGQQAQVLAAATERLAALQREADQRAQAQSGATAELVQQLAAFRSETEQRAGQQLAAADEFARQLAALAQQLGRSQAEAAQCSAQLEALARQLAATRDEAGLPTAVERENFDSFYLAFENAFRGTREEIRTKQSTYTPQVTAALARTGLPGWIDLGCGRGEWLELVQQLGGQALGIDTNPAMLALCRERGLQVVASDAIAYLQSLPPDSAAGISAFHLIEHIPDHKFVTLVTEARRVLAPGGCLILETPNPQNAIVGMCNFYIDPTHLNPIPPMTAEFTAKHAGFTSVTVLRLSPFPRYAERDALPTVIEREFCEFFYGPQDYGIVAVK